MHRLTPTSAQKLLTCLCTYCEAVIRELAILGRFLFFSSTRRHTSSDRDWSSDVCSSDLALEVPPQDIITRDNVTLKVNAVIFLRVIDPRRAVVEVSNYVYQTSQFAQTTLRSVLGEQELDELLSHREKINLRLQSILDTHTSPWGVKVTNVEVKQVDMPESMLRAMAKQAEAEREKR